jgi:hypothetical protein
MSIEDSIYQMYLGMVIIQAIQVIFQLNLVVKLLLKGELLC